MERIDLDEIGIKEKMKAEVERIKKFQRSILGVNTKIVVKDVDIRNYTKYILKDGSIFEKRELLSHLKSTLTLNNKVLILKN